MIHVAKIPKMTPSALNTMLNSAPMVIQGASKLIKLIKEQSSSKPDDDAAYLLTVEGLKAEIQHLESRLATTNESNIEQIKLIEQLAKQNEALAASMAKGNARLNLMTIVVVLVSLVAIAALTLTLLR